MNLTNPLKFLEALSLSHHLKFVWRAFDIFSLHSSAVVEWHVITERWNKLILQIP